jgi:hypothetical protein
MYKKLRICFNADQNSVKPELEPGYLMQLKDAIRQPQLLQCGVVRWLLCHSVLT